MYYYIYLFMNGVFIRFMPNYIEIIALSFEYVKFSHSDINQVNFIVLAVKLWMWNIGMRVHEFLLYAKWLNSLNLMI